MPRPHASRTQRLSAKRRNAPEGSGGPAGRSAQIALVEPASPGAVALPSMPTRRTPKCGVVRGRRTTGPTVLSTSASFLGRHQGRRPPSPDRVDRVVSEIQTGGATQVRIQRFAHGLHTSQDAERVCALVVSHQPSGAPASFLRWRGMVMVRISRVFRDSVFNLSSGRLLSAAGADHQFRVTSPRAGRRA